VLSKKVPYYKYIQDSQIRSALSRDELLARPVSTDGDTEEIDDKSWDLITQCCVLDSEKRLKLVDIQNRLRWLDLKDNRPAAKPLPGVEVLKERMPYAAVDILRVGEILDKLKVSGCRVKVQPLTIRRRFIFPRSLRTERMTMRTRTESTVDPLFFDIFRTVALQLLYLFGLVNLVCI
jgi:hypothetical protein